MVLNSDGRRLLVPMQELVDRYLALQARPGAGDLSGTLVMGERNFCKLRFEGGRADRRLQLQVINADGEPKWQQVLSAGDLGAASAP